MKERTEELIPSAPTRTEAVTFSPPSNSTSKSPVSAVVYEWKGWLQRTGEEAERREERREERERWKLCFPFLAATDERVPAPHRSRPQAAIVSPSGFRTRWDDECDEGRVSPRFEGARECWRVRLYPWLL